MNCLFKMRRQWSQQKIFKRHVLRSAQFIFICSFFVASTIFADDFNSTSFDYAKPAQLNGTLYAIGSSNVLFTFRRTATQSNSAVYVRRQFLTPGGSVAAEEDVAYNSGRLQWYEMREFQAGISGAIEIFPDPKNPAQKKLFISYGHGLTPPAKGNIENVPPNTVIDDNLYAFMLQHWDDLMAGRSVKFQFVSLEHEKTYGFRLVRAGESIERGEPVEKIKMEATGFFVSKFVAPLVFVVEKNSPHHIFSYTGLTTPRIKKGNQWKYFDAETVFHWQ
jgi:hypothetical protein